MAEPIGQGLHFSVVIVGAGPVGLVAANLLGQAGISVLIVEREAGLYPHPRAISIDDEGLRICQALGSGKEILDQTLLNIQAHYLSRSRLLVKVAPAAQLYGYPLISTFHQPALEAILFEGLRRFPHISLSSNQVVVDCKQGQAKVSLEIESATGERREISCDYLLACDGGRSQIRHTLQIPFRGTSAEQRWAVVDCTQRESGEPIARFFCDPERPAVSVPAPGSRLRWEFMLLPGEVEQDLLPQIPALIEKLAPGSHPQIQRRAIYTFHSRLAERFQQGRIFLLGDAAHLMPPFGGQGLNSGLRDAHNLCWKLALVLQGQAAPGLLESYQEERRPHAARMIRFSTFLGSVIMPTARSIALVRDRVLSLAAWFPPTRSLLAEAGIKPSPRYRPGLRVQTFRFRDPLRSQLGGTYLPQPELHLADGTRALLDDVAGSGFLLLRLANPRTEELPLDGLAGLPVREIRIVSAPDVSCGNSQTESASDPSGEIRHLLRGRDDLCLLVRPDRFILDVFPTGEAEAFFKEFRSWLKSEQRKPR